MNFKKLSLNGLVLIEPQVFEDERGFFMETYNKKVFIENGINVDFVQDNHSRSSFGVLRGLHFQKPPFAQDKLVRVTSGEVLDVAVDVRPESPTFGKWEAIHLSAQNKNIFFIPKGFAHGFYVLSETVDFEYKVSNFYSKESEAGIIWNDPDLNVTWYSNGVPVVSQKDQVLPKFKEIEDQLKQLVW